MQMWYFFCAFCLTVKGASFGSVALTCCLMTLNIRGNDNYHSQNMESKLICLIPHLLPQKDTDKT